jgi:hypothetical protein
VSLTEYETWGGGGVADPGSVYLRILIFSQPGSPRSGIQQQQNEKGKKFICSFPFCSQKLYKVESFLVFGTGTEKDSRKLTINLSILKCFNLFFFLRGIFCFFSVLFY